MATNGMRKLNPHDRSTRNGEIVAARAAGESWRRIGEHFDVSGRQARRIVRDVGARVTNTTVIDPIGIIEAAVLRCEAVIEQLAEIADTANPRVAVKAISAQLRVAESEMALLQNAGMLPSPLLRIGYEIDARRAASRAVEVLNRHGVSVDGKAEMLSALTAP